MKIKLRMVKTLLFTALLATVFVAVSCTKKEDFTTDNVQDVINSEKRDEGFGVADNESSEIEMLPDIFVEQIKTIGEVNTQDCTTEVQVILQNTTCTNYPNKGNVLYYNWSYTPDGPYYESTPSLICNPIFVLGPGTSYLRISTQPNGGGATSELYSKGLPWCIPDDKE
ncbi:MAG: hypothetical protein ACKVOK_16085 [Flavobacteriales bacterium]